MGTFFSIKGEGVGMKLKANYLKCLSGLLIFLSALTYFLYDQNNRIDLSFYAFHSEKVNEAVDGFKIIQLSDLHSKYFGKDQKRVIHKILEEKPDLIVVTGDLVDSKRYDEVAGLVLLEALVSTAPVFFVSGNHEAWSHQFDVLERRLKEIGVVVLRNESQWITIETSGFMLIGMDDPSFGQHEMYSFGETLQHLVANTKSEFTILLSHRPEFLNAYSGVGVDLVFSGHAHGGQVRLPFVGGLVAPDQGFFPRYTAGLYDEGVTTMVVNRGLGNSIVPQRLFNRPEIVVLTLRGPGKVD